MASSLESRTPYLARAVVEMVASIPSDLKLHGSMGRYTGKWVLKRAIARLLPERTLRKKKAGFNAPTNLWLGVRSGENEFRYFNRYVAARRDLPVRDPGPVVEAQAR